MSPQEGVNPRGVDTASASIARVYDAVLGGKDNFDVDRQAARDALAVPPSMPDLVVSGRRWLIRVVGYLADRCGMQQFLDLGSGLPTVQNTHEVAQRYQPEAHVVYVDNEPAGTTGRSCAINDWLALSGITSGPLLRRGMATEARRDGAYRVAIERQGRWAPGSRQVDAYLEQVDRERDNAALHLGRSAER